MMNPNKNKFIFVCIFFSNFDWKIWDEKKDVERDVAENWMAIVWNITGVQWFGRHPQIP